MNQLLQLLGSILLACVPAMIWGHIFFKKQPENRHMTRLTFALGALSVFPILLYKFSWNFFPWLNAFNFADRFQNDMIGFSNWIMIPVSVIITFMIVGIIEEIMKLLAVKVADDKVIRSIDDAIEFFIIAALGFSFTENILYFYNIWLSQGAADLFLPFLFRSSFSTFAHLLFSGVLGYYYGIAHFAKPILQEQLKQKRATWTVTLHKIFGFRQDKMFHEEKLLEGLVISIILHAMFNIFLEMNLTFMIVPFLIFGYSFLSYLLDKAENHKDYGHILEDIRNHEVFETKVKKIKS